MRYAIATFSQRTRVSSLVAFRRDASRGYPLERDKAGSRIGILSKRPVARWYPPARTRRCPVTCVSSSSKEEENEEEEEEEEEDR